MKKILYLTSIVPEKELYHNIAFTRSGNNVCQGIGEALWERTSCEILSFAPMPSFPRGKLFFSKKEESFPSGMKVTIAPLLNMKALKNICIGIYSFFWILNWARKNKGEELYILTYNIYSPPVNILYWASKLAHAKLYVILYDLGVPPKRLGLSKLTMLSYRISERAAKKYIPKLDGRIVINESIIKNYAPGKDYILVDGGISNEVIANLFPLRESQDEYYTFLCAGMLWDQNGTKLILDAMKVNTNDKIRVIFAGKGIDVPLIEEAAEKDNRIKYVGMLSMQELFKVYEGSDVLMNLRIEEEIDFHFPSKLLEFLVMGKKVLSTDIAHAGRDYGEYIQILSDVTPEGLSKAMDEITKISKRDLYENGKKSRQFMLENRNWEKRTEEILEYMNKVN